MSCGQKVIELSCAVLFFITFSQLVPVSSTLNVPWWDSTTLWECCDSHLKRNACMLHFGLANVPQLGIHTWLPMGSFPSTHSSNNQLPAGVSIVSFPTDPYYSFSMNCAHRLTGTNSWTLMMRLPQGLVQCLVVRPRQEEEDVDYQGQALRSYSWPGPSFSMFVLLRYKQAVSVCCRYRDPVSKQ